MKLFSWNRLIKAVSQPQRLFGIIVIIPFLLSVIYFTFFAVDRYVSNAQVVVRQSDAPSSPIAPSLAILTGGIDPASREYTLYLKEYIASYEMLLKLDERINWTGHYADHLTDPLYYLSSDAPIEEKLVFYNKMVMTHYNDTTGLLSIEVQALSPEFAEKIMQEIILESKKFINIVSREMLLEQAEFANQELIASTERYQKSKEDMVNFQNYYKLLDVEATAQARLELISALESEVAKENARLTALANTLSIKAPQVKALQNKIYSLEEQLKIEKARITSNSIDDPLNSIASEYRQLQVNMLVAEEFYKTSLAVVENAKMDAIKNVRNLITIVPPIVPEESTYPRIFYNLLTMFIVLSFVYGIVCFVVASIKDHYE